MKNSWTTGEMGRGGETEGCEKGQSHVVFIIVVMSGVGTSTCRCREYKRWDETSERQVPSRDKREAPEIQPLVLCAPPNQVPSCAVNCHQTLLSSPNLNTCITHVFNICFSSTSQFYVSAPVLGVAAKSFLNVNLI